jgi:2-oxoglutarate ferredoxin oxidoreductase subunit gamma
VERSIVFAGFGGQGILFAGHVLAEAANMADLEVLWIPSYGPEMRGGTASCTVIVSAEPIGSPVVDRADAAVVMNPPSLARFAPTVREGGLLVINGSLIDALSGRTDLIELRLPCTELARRSGDDRLVSVVGLGALVERLPLVDPALIEAAIHLVVGTKRPQVEAADVAAFRAGREAVGSVLAG